VHISLLFHIRRWCAYTSTTSTISEREREREQKKTEPKDKNHCCAIRVVISLVSKKKKNTHPPLLHLILSYQPSCIWDFLSNWFNLLITTTHSVSISHRRFDNWPRQSINILVHLGDKRLLDLNKLDHRSYWICFHMNDMDIHWNGTEARLTDHSCGNSFKGEVDSLDLFIALNQEKNYLLLFCFYNLTSDTLKISFTYPD
jgi:hypothetical protein